MKSKKHRHWYELVKLIQQPGYWQWKKDNFKYCECGKRAPARARQRGRKAEDKK